MASPKRLIGAALAAALTIAPGVAGAQNIDDVANAPGGGRGGETIDVGPVQDIVIEDGRQPGVIGPSPIDDVAGINPSIEGLWLADAASDSLIEQISPGEVFDRADLPSELAIVAVANGDTESVQFGWEGAIAYHVENQAPYALDGDANGDLFASDIDDGWHTVRARPFAADGASGSYGDEVLLSFGVFQETIVVESTLDLPDSDPGDGVCSGSLTGGVDDFQQRAPSGADDNSGDQLTTGQRNEVESFTDGQPSSSNRSQLAGPCTLRAAIEEANARSGRQVIEVPYLGHYVLTRGQLHVTDTVTIEGSGLPVIDAEGRNSVMHIETTGDVALIGLSMRNGVGEYSNSRGGVLRIDDATVEIVESHISGGQANFGGGLYAQGADVAVIRSVFQNNTAGHPDDFDNSGSTQRGGGISSLQSVLTLDSSTIIGNRAVRGGGVSIAGGQAFITNTSILENEAVQRGGGFELITSEGEEPDVHLAWSTVARNEAGTLVGDGSLYRTGGGFHLGAGSLISANSIIADNTTDLPDTDEHWSPDCWSDDAGDFISYRGNLVGVLNDNCIMYDTHLDEVLMWDMFGSNAAPLDPGFGSISYAVRPTIGLQAGSPAVDHGTGAPGVEFYGYCPDVDGRDNPRPADDSLCDIGASERQ